MLLQLRLAGLAVLLLAAAIRLPSLTAGRPYMSYADEGYVFQAVSGMLRTGSWDPNWYMYPSLPLTAIAAASRLYAPFHPLRHEGRSFRQDLADESSVYDFVEPFELVFLGRLLTFLIGLAVVGLTGLYASRLLGPPAGLFAAFLAALIPPLALRGGIATVDPWATFFVLASFFFADRVRTSPRPNREALLAGLMAGFAFAAKYPAILAVGGAMLPLTTGRSSAPERPQAKDKLIRAGTGILGLAIGMIVGMPALILHPREVSSTFQQLDRLYENRAWTPPLWHQAFVRAEWDLPFEHPELGVFYLILAAAGAGLALRDRGLARTAGGWLLFAALCLALNLSKSFQAFRNLLPLVPLSCVAVAVLFARMRERLPSRIWVDAGAALLVLGLFAVPVLGWTWERAQLVDARVEAIDWLVAHARPEDSVLVLREIAFLPSELRRLPSPSMERGWSLLEADLREQPALPPFLVVGRIKRPGRRAHDLAANPDLLRCYGLRARFGDAVTPAAAGKWKGNRQTIYVFERRRC